MAATIKQTNSVPLETVDCNIDGYECGGLSHVCYGLVWLSGATWARRLP